MESLSPLEAHTTKMEGERECRVVDILHKPTPRQTPYATLDDDKPRLVFLVNKLSTEYHQLKDQRLRAVQTAVAFSEVINQQQETISSLQQEKAELEGKAAQTTAVIADLKSTLQRAPLEVRNTQVQDVIAKCSAAADYILEKNDDRLQLVSTIDIQRNEIAKLTKVINQLTNIIENS
eukprot:NODE_5894_length_597_cov_11.059574_g5729_i0.p1 GENE.NODE_5894_length_597_cov_11.059574_g5729_i0~~NODE_5894_length_597_cov_11.059574_g5729_i0.p1  ORF type:complete len:178 (-),score=50.76 NODE_5894_length_597_cov_11.059574_g5729_i0:16-549(-)